MNTGEKLHWFVKNTVKIKKINSRLLFSFLIEPLVFIYRLTNIFSLIIHGFGHAFALYIVTGSNKSLSLHNILEGQSLDDLITSLLPLQSLPQLTVNPPQLLIQKLNTLQCRVVAIGGIVFNLLTVFCIVEYSEFLLLKNNGGLFGSILGQLFFLSFTLSSIFTACSIPDIVVLLRGKGAILACGPAFAVRYKLGNKNSSAIVSEHLRNLVKILAKEAATRGGQSGGFSIITRKLDAESIIFDKVVKGKREDIVEVVSQKINALLKKAEKEGYSRPKDYEVILLHLRYATGGATHWHNAQPHWYEHSDAMMQHRIQNNQLHSEVHEVFNMIAHNGDMDGLHLTFRNNGEYVRHLFTQPEARTIFQTIMPWSTSQGNSDSRSIAEWVDFVYTQGLTFKSLRYAYFTAALDFNEQICCNQFDLNKLYEWAEQLDLFLLNIANSEECFSADVSSINLLNSNLKQDFKRLLLSLISSEIEEDRQQRFLRCFEDAFFRHDLTWVMRQASLDFVGEFALMVCSTMEKRMGVFSLTQAFSIGHNLTRGEIFGSAEPQGVTSALHQGHEGDQALQIYLQDGQYATIDYQETKDRDSVLIYNRAQLSDDFSLLPQPAANTSLVNSSLNQQSEWFPVNQNKKIERYSYYEKPGQGIEKDLQDIPFILKRIKESFLPQGENWATMECFCELIFQNLLSCQSEPDKYDLVLFGVDFNQDLTNEFSLALGSILPALKITAENSGNVLKAMKRIKREGVGPYGKKTIFIGVSNSAQTQSTLAATRKAEELVGSQQCFILTQSLLNSMSQALGQGYHVNDQVIPNTFVNLTHQFPDGSCGRRRSEAATVIPVATQAVLTEILIGLAQRALEIHQSLFKDALTNKKQHFAIRHDLQSTDIEAFREFQSAVYEIEIPNRVGFNSAGEEIDSPDTESIEKEARERAENNIEFVRSYALFAAYIFIATLFGIPVFSVLSSPLQSITGVGFIVHVLDATLFLTSLWLIHMGFRFYQGRPIFERIGARAELFIDRQYIARMVERYNATLFSNAPAFLTPFFYWADTVQDALHRFGIRAHRGVVTIHRTPDERMGIEEANNAAEDNMVFAQIGGIRFNLGQPQSRDKVRNGSWYMNRTEEDRLSRPFQSVLSDSLESLRKKYDRKLSPEIQRLINRRLIDLSDGLVFEFVVGLKRKNHVNRSIWMVISWLPGSHWVKLFLMQYGIDIQNIIGHAGTANQAQIQSTKHPVSPMDIRLDTMEPRSTYGSFSGQQKSSDDLLAVLVFFDDHLSINFNEQAMLNSGNTRFLEINLYPQCDGTLSSQINDPVAGEFNGCIRRVSGKDHLLIENKLNDLQFSFLVSQLTHEQQQFLNNKLHIVNIDDFPNAA
jgi:hypothetical protein